MKFCFSVVSKTKHIVKTLGKKDSNISVSLTWLKCVIRLSNLHQVLDVLSTNCSNNKLMSKLWNVYKTAAASLIPVPELQGLFLLIQCREIVGQVLKTAVLSLQISLTSQVPTAGHMCFAVCPRLLFFPLRPFEMRYLILCERFKAFY